jgi:lysophospholipase L1-like esterase
MIRQIFKAGAPGLLALFAASALAQIPQLQKVPAPTSLTPLAMSIGGRAMAMPAGSRSGFGDDVYVSQWPGSHFEAAFKGTEVYFGVGPEQGAADHEILHVVVDGHAPMILTNPETGVYLLSGLEDAAHAVGVFVATESGWGPTHFRGFAIAATAKALAPPKRARQIEFIGDSHTVGYGNTSPKRDCTNDEVWVTTDDTQAFGPLTANHYGAEYQVNAISGHGVVRNYDGGPGDPVPVAYPYVLFDRKQLYSDPAWRPQVIVISLGTNDFTTPLHEGEKWKTRADLHADYEATYMRFIESLRAKDRDAFLILWATQIANGEIEAEVKKVVEQAKAQGDKRIAFLPIDNLTFSACNGHPSLSDDRTIRGKLIELIDATPRIWPEQ